MKILNIHPINKIVIILLLMLSIILIFSCGTKTKNKSENEVKEIVTQDEKNEFTQKKFDSLKIVLEEEFRKKSEENNSEKTNTEATKTTTIEVTETEKSPTADFKPVAGTDLFLRPSDGKIIERKTKTIIEERFNQEQLKKQQIQIEEERKIDEKLQQTSKETIDAVSEMLLQFEKKQSEKNKDVVQEGWQPGFWFWFWAVLILLLIIAFFLFRKWLLIQFPFLAILFKRKKTSD